MYIILLEIACISRTISPNEFSFSLLIFSILSSHYFDVNILLSYFILWFLLLLLVLFLSLSLLSILNLLWWIIWTSVVVARRDVIGGLTIGMSSVNLILSSFFILILSNICLSSLSIAGF
jgi:hypothetical protein